MPCKYVQNWQIRHISPIIYLKKIYIFIRMTFFTKIKITLWMSHFKKNWFFRTCYESYKNASWASEYWIVKTSSERFCKKYSVTDDAPVKLVKISLFIFMNLIDRFKLDFFYLSSGFYLSDVRKLFCERFIVWMIW